MKHQPDVFGFVQADFDEMIASAQRAEMIDVISTIQRWMFLKNEVVRRLQGLPHFCISRRDVVPGTSIAFAAVIGTSMRYRSFDCFPNLLQTLGQIAGIQSRLNGHHSASDIDTHSGWNDRAFGWNDAADRCSDPPMNVGHRRNPTKDERQLRHIQQLCLCFGFDGYAASPGTNWDSVFAINNVVSVRHFFSPLSLRRQTIPQAFAAGWRCTGDKYRRERRGRTG